MPHARHRITPEVIFDALWSVNASPKGILR